MKKILVCISLFLLVHGAQAASESKRAEEFINELGQKVIDLLTNNEISDQERAKQFREILATSFDLKAIGKFVLGKHWKQATKEDREHFLSLFQETMVANYVTRFKEYTSEKFKVVNSRRDADGGVTILSQIIRPNGQVISIGWKVFEKKGKFFIYEVMLEGINMGITLRSEYGAVIQKGGGTLQALIKALEEKKTTYKE